MGVFIIMGQRLIISEEEQKHIRGLYEQNSNTSYKATGEKWCFLDSCCVTLYIHGGSEKRIRKSVEGKELSKIYSQLIKLVQDELTTKKIQNVTLPTLEQLILRDVKDDYAKVVKYYKDGNDSNWFVEDITQYDSWRYLNLKKSSDKSNCKMTIYVDNNEVNKKNCKSINGVNIPFLQGKWKWAGNKPSLNFKTKDFITKNATGYYQDTDVDTQRGKIMNIGSRGPMVKKVQQWLSINGHGDTKEIAGNEKCKTDVNLCDGVYGKKTKDAVIKFQKLADINVDGIVGDETLLAMDIK